MIEIYLFVNPLDKHCLDIEEKFLSIINSETQKVHFRVIPMINPQLIHNFIKENHLEHKGLDYRNQLFSSIYSACLDVKAAQLQGMFIGKKFLLELQDTVGRQNIPYSKDLAYQIFEKMPADLSIFKEDRQSELVVDFFNNDQQIAREMKVSSFSTAVIFNYLCPYEYGLSIDANLPSSIIRELIEHQAVSSCPGTLSLRPELPRGFYFDKKKN
ncbi:DsbA family protein [Vagococcus sp.]|uniref:DsbA family protein n=1 Tax=Vagococcus sp. TaxID=1933889 RepID=UPI003F94AE22